MKPTHRSPKYYVTCDGRIFHFFNGKIHQKKPQLDSGTGYFKVCFYYQSEKRERSFFIHDLVAASYIGQRPKGMCVMHVDRNKQNNDVTNLRYATKGECNRNSADPCGKDAIPVILENTETGRILKLPTMTTAARFLKVGIPTLWRQALRVKERKASGSISQRRGFIGVWKVKTA